MDNYLAQSHIGLFDSLCADAIHRFAVSAQARCQNPPLYVGYRLDAEMKTRSSTLFSDPMSEISDPGQ